MIDNRRASSLFPEKKNTILLVPSFSRFSAIHSSRISYASISYLKNTVYGHMVHETFEIFFIMFCNTSRIEAGKQATYNIGEGNKKEKKHVNGMEREKSSEM